MYYNFYSYSLAFQIFLQNANFMSRVIAFSAKIFEIIDFPHYFHLFFVLNFHPMSQHFLQNNQKLKVKIGSLSL